MSNNKIGDAGAMELSKCCSQLVVLELQYNKIGGAGAEVLCQALGGTTCRTRDLPLFLLCSCSHACLCYSLTLPVSFSVPVVCRAFRLNRIFSLWRIHSLGWSHLELYCAFTFCLNTQDLNLTESLSISRCELVCGHNTACATPIDRAVCGHNTACATPIDQAVCGPGSACLQQLDMSHNSIDDSAVDALGVLVSRARKLVTLQLHQNPMSNEANAALVLSAAKCR